MQLLAIILLWIVFLVTQQQKAKYNRCTIAFFVWFGGQSLLLLAATAAGVLYEVRKARSDADHIDPEMREILLGHDLDNSAGISDLI